MPQTNVLADWQNTYGFDAPVQKPGGVYPGALLASTTVPNKLPGYAAPPPTVPPLNVSPPVVSGGTAIGSVLSCTSGVWSPIGTYVYQWKSGGANIAGQTGTSYTAVSGDVGKTITCVVTATNVNGSVSVTSNALGPIVSAPPVNTATPVVSGSVVVGSVLSCNSGNWSPTGTFTYQWQSGGINVPGQTGTSYTTVSGDIGNSITCIVTATNPSGSTPATSNAVGPITVAPPVNTVAPVVSGATIVGSVLSCTSGTWSPTGTFTYQWQSGGSNISGQTGTSYTTQAVDVGKLIACTVTCAGSGGSTSATSNAVGPITSTATSTGSSYYYLGF